MTVAHRQFNSSLAEANNYRNSIAITEAIVDPRALANPSLAISQQVTSPLAAAVALAIPGLAAAVLLVAFGEKRLVVSAAIDGYTRAAVPALVVTHVLPHLHEEVGLAATPWWSSRCGLLAPLDDRARSSIRDGSRKREGTGRREDGKDENQTLPVFVSFWRCPSGTTFFGFGSEALLPRRRGADARCAPRRSWSDALEGPVVVAVTAVGMMQVAIDEVVDMVPVGNRFMTAARAVAV
jgi:hypothetical protein